MNEEPNRKEDVDSFRWTLSEDRTTITLIGKGTMKDYNKSDLRPPWFEDCERTTKLVVSDGIASIGNDAFSDCSSLTSITLPSSLTSIGNGAFSNCASLTSITLPNSLTSIAEDAFSHCYYLLEITIPETCTFSTNTFKDCFGLAVVNAWKSAFGPLNVKDTNIQQHIKNILYFLSYLEGYYEGKRVREDF